MGIVCEALGWWFEACLGGGGFQIPSLTVSFREGIFVFFSTLLAAGLEEATGRMAYTEDLDERTTLRLGVMVNGGYFTTTPPLMGRIKQPISCWTSGVTLTDKDRDLIEHYAQESLTNVLEGEALRNYLLQREVIVPVLIGYEDPYWFLDAVQVSYMTIASCFMSEHGWTDLTSEAMPEHVFELVVPQAWTLELPKGVSIRKVQANAVVPMKASPQALGA